MHPETGQRLPGRAVGTIPETDLPAAHLAVEGALGFGALDVASVRDGRAWLVVSEIYVASDAADATEAAGIQFRYP